MTPYVQLQKEVVRVLQRWLTNDHPNLQYFAKKYCVVEKTQCKKITEEDLCILVQEGVTPWPETYLKDFYSDTLGVILQQIDLSEGLKSIKIRNLLGFPLYPKPSVGWDEYIADRGTGNERLRVESCANPGALEIGDILASGETVCELPREGGNGAVLVKLSTHGGLHTVWMSYSARTVLALIAAAGNPTPNGLVH